MAKVGASPKHTPGGGEELGKDLGNLIAGCFSSNPNERKKARSGCGCLIVLIIAAIIAYIIMSSI